MRIGFTGTQRGMTPAQKLVLADCLKVHDGEFHHGDCYGADAEARSLRYCIIVHPPIKETKRAFRSGDILRQAKDYLERNKDIVLETERLVASPGEDEEQLRSGTWSTVRFARKMKRRIYIIQPNGKLKCEAHDMVSA